MSLDVVSYRGPGVAGGVSSGLGTAWRNQSKADSSWWFLNNGALEVLSAEAEQSTFIAQLPDTLVQGHYGFCNEFLWPLMHDLPQYVTYSAEQHEQYNGFNKLISDQINLESKGRQEYFIQDYQLGIAPRWLALYGHKAVVFWHIPWPKHVPKKYAEPICELVRGLLGASAVGFHTPEYANNFMDFVSSHLPEYRIDWTTMTIAIRDEKSSPASRRLMRTIHKSQVKQQNTAATARSATAIATSTSSSTKLLVHPLGIDVAYWTELKELSLTMNVEPQLKKLANGKYVLSVDRVDYTKSVLDRLHIIDRFFEKHPQWVGTLSFVQVCGRSRSGLPAFDQYWHSCRFLAEAVNKKWQLDGWEPVRWIDRSLSNEELAYLYANAESMLVNPVRDGLNLTAKEFVACQGDQPGTLLLSSGAGAIHELGDLALTASPQDYGSTVASLARSLTMPLKERQARMIEMRTILVSNQLSHWWSTFSNVTANPIMQLLGRGEEIIERKIS